MNVNNKIYLALFSMILLSTLVSASDFGYSNPTLPKLNEPIINGAGTICINCTINISGGSGSQTPWTQNINGNGYNLSNVNTIGLSSSAGNPFIQASNLYGVNILRLGRDSTHILDIREPVTTEGGVTIQCDSNPNSLFMTDCELRGNNLYIYTDDGKERLIGRYIQDQRNTLLDDGTSLVQIGGIAYGTDSVFKITSSGNLIVQGSLAYATNNFEGGETYIGGTDGVGLSLGDYWSRHAIQALTKNYGSYDSLNSMFLQPRGQPVNIGSGVTDNVSNALNVEGSVQIGGGSDDYSSLYVTGGNINIANGNLFVNKTIYTDVLKANKATIVLSDPESYEASQSTRERQQILDTQIPRDKKGIDIYMNEETGQLEYWNKLTGDITDKTDKIIGNMRSLGYIKDGYFLNYNDFNFYKKTYVHTQEQNGTVKVVVDQSQALTTAYQNKLNSIKRTGKLGVIGINPEPVVQVKTIYQFNPDTGEVDAIDENITDNSNQVQVLNNGITFNSEDGQFYREHKVFINVTLEGTPIKVSIGEAIQ